MKYLHKFNQVMLYVFVAFVLINCKDDEEIIVDDTDDDINIVTGSFTDSRDGKVYETVTIGSQVWMAENLKYLPNVVGAQVGSNSAPHYYVYGYNGTNVNDAKATSNFEKYGVLYNWSAAMAGSSKSNTNPSGVQGVCPNGWHLPSEAEWLEFINFIGGEAVAGGKLKEKGTEHWDAPNEGATDDFGFTALPAGVRSSIASGNFINLGATSFWWTTSESSNPSGDFTTFSRGVFYDKTEIVRSQDKREVGGCVRCIRD